MDLNMISILGALVLIAVWAYGVYRENSGDVLKRGPYIMMCLGAFVFTIIVGFIAGFSGIGEEPAILITTAVQVVVGYILAGKTTQRARDAGWPKAWVYCMVVPIVGFIIMLILFFKGSVDPDAQIAEPA